MERSVFWWLLLLRPLYCPQCKNPFLPLLFHCWQVNTEGLSVIFYLVHALLSYPSSVICHCTSFWAMTTQPLATATQHPASAMATSRFGVCLRLETHQISSLPLALYLSRCSALLFLYFSFYSLFSCLYCLSFLCFFPHSTPSLSP